MYATSLNHYAPTTSYKAMPNGRQTPAATGDWPTINQFLAQARANKHLGTHAQVKTRSQAQ